MSSYINPLNVYGPFVPPTFEAKMNEVAEENEDNTENVDIVGK